MLGHGMKKRLDLFYWFLLHYLLKNDTNIVKIIFYKAYNTWRYLLVFNLRRSKSYLKTCELLAYAKNELWLWVVKYVVCYWSEMTSHYIIITMWLLYILWKWDYVHSHNKTELGCNTQLFTFTMVLVYC